MSNISDLHTLLARMEPALLDGEYVFCSVPESGAPGFEELRAVAFVREEEGLTLVLPRQSADAASLPYAGIFRMITLRVHSSLDAVGLTAAVAGCLAERGISANVIAGYYHDHVFVPARRADEAVYALLRLTTLDTSATHLYSSPMNQTPRGAAPEQHPDG